MIVEFVIPTFNRVNPLFTMLYSLINQTNPNWKAHVVIDNVKDSKAEEIVKSFNDTRVYYTYLDKRYNDWGHTPRNYGKQNSDADYIIMTGDNNYYVPVTVDWIIKYANLKDSVNPGFIYWQMVHSHGGYCHFNCEPFHGRIDMGSFATRKDIAHQIPLGVKYAADGDFIEEFKRRFPDEKKLKIPHILFVHN